MAALTAALVLAQDTPPATTSDASASSDTSDYAGPSVLTRGGGPSLGAALSHVRLRPFITLDGIYDGSLGNTLLNSQGNIPYVNAYGVQLTLGASGTRQWKHSSLALDYRGELRHYNKHSYYDGVDNALSLTFKHYLSTRTQFELFESAARYSRAYSMSMEGYYGGGAQAYDSTFSSLTTNDLYDTPTSALTSGGRLIHQRTARVSLSGGISGFIVRRRSTALIGTNGYTAQGDIAYRLSRYQTISIGYSFSHYDFQNSYGQSDMHGASLAYSVQIGRHFELALLGGGYRVESLRLTRITFDPVIAALLGQAYGLEKFYGVSYMPRAGAHLTRKFRDSMLGLGYDRNVAAGNGVFTTASYETGQIGYTYTGVRRLSLQTGASYQRFSALTQSIGRYRTFQAGAGCGYNLGRGLSLVLRGDVRRYYISNSSLNRLQPRVVAGIGWTPGDYPLALW
jgi:hypothetical protein